MQGKGFVQREGAVKSPRIFMEVWYFLGFFVWIRVRAGGCRPMVSCRSRAS